VKNPVWNFQDKLLRQISHLREVQEWQYQNLGKLNQWAGSYDLIIRLMENLASDVGRDIKRRNRPKSEGFLRRMDFLRKSS
jgi:hypothetical protein